MVETREDLPEEASDFDKEEVKSAKEVVQLLTKTAKTLKIYLPNNLIHQKFINSFLESLQGHLEEYGSLRLRIKQFELLCSGKPIYENINRLESMAFKFFIDGLREISFHPGIEKDEVIDFLQIIGQEIGHEGADDDLITLLWEKNLAHVKYIVVDDLQGDEEELEACKEMNPRPPKPQQLRAVFNQESKPVTTDLAPKGVEIPSLHIFKLSEDEIGSIKRELRWEEEIDIVNELEGMLFDIIRIESDPASFLEVMNIIDNILEELMFKGDFPHARKILEFFWEMADPSKKLALPLQQIVEKALVQAGNPKRITGLDAVLNGLSPDQFSHFFPLMILFKKEVIPPVIELLASVNTMKARRVICDILVELGQVDVESIISRLDDDRWYVLRNLIYVLGKIGDERAIGTFSKFIDHEELKIRKEVLHVLDAMKDPEAEQLLIRFILDPDLSNRVYAMKSLVKKGVKEGLSPILALITSKDFGTKALYEKKEIFNAVAKLGGDAVVPEIKGHLNHGWRFFKNVQSDELGLCAAMALQRIGTPVAVDALQEGTQSRNKIVREACEKALGVIGAAKQT